MTGSGTEPQPPKKKRKKATPLKGRSAKILRTLGYLVGDVERHVPHTFITFDFMGFADLLAYRGEETGVTAIQVTHASRAADHERTILSPELRENVDAWVRAGNRVHLHLWDMRGPRGGKKSWTLFSSNLYAHAGGLRFTARIQITNNPPG